MASSGREVTGLWTEVAAVSLILVARMTLRRQYVTVNAATFRSSCYHFANPAVIATGKFVKNTVATFC